MLDQTALTYFCKRFLNNTFYLKLSKNLVTRLPDIEVEVDGVQVGIKEPCKA